MMRIYLFSSSSIALMFGRGTDDEKGDEKRKTSDEIERNFPNEPNIKRREKEKRKKMFVQLFYKKNKQERKYDSLLRFLKVTERKLRK